MKFARWVSDLPPDSKLAAPDLILTGATPAVVRSYLHRWPRLAQAEIVSFCDPHNVGVPKGPTWAFQPPSLQGSPCPSVIHGPLTRPPGLPFWDVSGHGAPVEVARMANVSEMAFWIAARARGKMVWEIGAEASAGLIAAGILDALGKVVCLSPVEPSALALHALAQRDAWVERTWSDIQERADGGLIQ